MFVRLLFALVTKDAKQGSATILNQHDPKIGNVACELPGNVMLLFLAIVHVAMTCDDELFQVQSTSIPLKCCAQWYIANKRRGNRLLSLTEIACIVMTNYPGCL